jgi:23S rRNA pseudouridine1911/1915/1917 synthase
MELRIVIMNLHYISDNKYKNINQVLNDEFKISSRLKSKLISNQLILLNGTFVDTRTSISKGDTIDIILDYPENNSNIIATNMFLNIIYEDDYLLIINKPAGIAVHPSILHYEDSLSNGVKFYYDKIGLAKKVRPVTRIDLNTSGLVVFAKNEFIQENLIRQMSNNSFKKIYLCLAEGIVAPEKGSINAPISRKNDSIIERTISNNGQYAVTNYEVLQYFEKYSLVKCILETGRTHQIRVHFAFIGHPLLGDSLYGNSSSFINRQALHCYNLKFIHPISQIMLNLFADIPDDFNRLCQ